MTFSKRFLFNAHNRRGLGHLMRGLNIAREIRKLTPTADIEFYTRSESAAELCGHQFSYFIEEDLEQNQHWPEEINRFAPDVIIYDTLLPKEELDTPISKAKTAYIMRKCKADRQQAIFSHPFTATADLILIPHDEEEFAYTLPYKLKGKCHFVGPIIRSAETQPQLMLRNKYGIQADDFLLTSTVGGGGFADKAQAFFDTIYQVHDKIRQRIPELKHLLVKGPNFTENLPTVDRLQIIDSESEMVNLLAISDLVIAEGGYNTVNEIRLAKTPAIFIPSDRNYDDQYERVEALENRGLAFVFDQNNADGIADLIMRAHAEQSLLTGIRKGFESDIIKTGNATAAKLLVDLAAQ